MRIDRRPLLETSVDADLFVGRAAETERVLRATGLGLNVAVDGSIGSGRSSFLRHLVFRLRALRRTAVLVGVSGADTPEELLTRVLQRAAGDEAAALARAAGFDADGLVHRLDEALTSTPSEVRPVLVLDDVGLAPGRALFGVLRDELWRVPATWVVSPEGSARALLRPPVDAFFEVTVDLPPMPPDELVELVARRLDGAVEAADLARLARLAGGSPRRALDLVRAVVLDGTPVDALHAASLRHRERLASLSEPAAALVRLVEQLGPLSPSDAEVQRRVGVTRPRLVTLFRELKEAGVVVELPPDRSAGGPGRPRIRYALTAAGPEGETAAAETVGPLRDAADT